LYVLAALSTGLTVFVVSPFLWLGGGRSLWVGPIVPVLGSLDVTTDELAVAAQNGLRLTALSLAFSAYALLLDHDRLVAAAGLARRSARLQTASRSAASATRVATCPARSAAAPSAASRIAPGTAPSLTAAP
ncbi:MAG: hypothetical protein H0V40_12275, partial [Actinobacteria bacterium]|nr:hypothetical protein [Actinomycetota bacterium]